MTINRKTLAKAFLTAVAAATAIVPAAAGAQTVSPAVTIAIATGGGGAAAPAAKETFAPDAQMARTIVSQTSPEAAIEAGLPRGYAAYYNSCTAPLRGQAAKVTYDQAAKAITCMKSAHENDIEGFGAKLALAAVGFAGVASGIAFAARPKGSRK